MKSRKILTAILAIIIVSALLASCGGGSTQTPTPAQQTPASNSPSPQTPASTPPSPPQTPANNNNDDDDYYDDDDDTEEYLDAMEDFVEGSMMLVQGLEQLMQAADHIDSYDDLETWCRLFIELKETIGDTADLLATLAPYAPDEYKESHIQFTFALAAVYDSMTGFEDAVDASLNGDEEAFLDGLGVFVGNLMAAEELFSEALGL